MLSRFTFFASPLQQKKKTKPREAKVSDDLVMWNNEIMKKNIDFCLIKK